VSRARRRWRQADIALGADISIVERLVQRLSGRKSLPTRQFMGSAARSIVGFFLSASVFSSDSGDDRLNQLSSAHEEVAQFVASRRSVVTLLRIACRS